MESPLEPEQRTIQRGNGESWLMKKHRTSLLHVTCEHFTREWRNFTILAISVLWASHPRHHTGPWSLHPGDKETGDRLLALSPVFQAQGPEQAKMSCDWENDLAFVITCIAGWVTMTVTCIRNNYSPLAAPASAPTPAPWIRGRLIYRGRIFEHGGDWWLPSSEKSKHFIMLNKANTHSK